MNTVGCLAYTCASPSLPPQTSEEEIGSLPSSPSPELHYEFDVAVEVRIKLGGGGGGGDIIHVLARV